MPTTTPPIHSPSAAPPPPIGPGSAARRPHWVADELFPFESRFLELDDCRLHYVDEGEGPAVLMLPGSPMWAFMYRHAIERLAPRFRCVAVDLPGLGLSSARRAPGCTFGAAADRLDRFVGELGLDDLVVVVHATAGPPGLEVAVRRHRNVRALVVSNTFAWPLDGSPRLRFFVRLVSSAAFGRLNRRLNLLPRVTARFGRRTGRFDDREAAAIRGPFERYEARDHLQDYLCGVRLERDLFALLETRLALFEATPSLLLFGAHDNGYAAGFLDRWRRLLPSHTAAVLEQSGHFPLEDEPGRWTEEVERFLLGSTV